jgi:2'-5' RNA ligase
LLDEGSLDRVRAATARRLSSGASVDSGVLAKALPYAPGPIATRWMANRQPQIEGKAAEDFTDGIMVALKIPDSLAEILAVPDGQPAEELHITLAFLGETTDVQDDSDFLLRLLGAVRDAAGHQQKMSGMLSGIGRFTGDDTDVFYLSADIPGLEDFRHSLYEALTEADIEPNRKHGFTPHVTLAYLSRDAELPWHRLDTRPVEFTEVHVVYGINWVPVPFGGDDPTEDDLGTGVPLPTTTSATVNTEGKTLPADRAARREAARAARALTEKVST